MYLLHVLSVWASRVLQLSMQTYFTDTHTHTHLCQIHTNFNKSNKDKKYNCMFILYILCYFNTSFSYTYTMFQSPIQFHYTSQFPHIAFQCLSIFDTRSYILYSNAPCSVFLYDISYVNVWLYIFLAFQCTLRYLIHSYLCYDM